MPASKDFTKPTRRTRSSTAGTSSPLPVPDITPLADTVNALADSTAATSTSDGSPPAIIDDVISIEEDSETDIEEDDLSNGPDENDIADPQGNLPVQLRPCKKPLKSGDKRRFGGSVKGRKCVRWTEEEENTAVEMMVKVRHNRDILGEKSFHELHRRLSAEHGNGWTRSVSSIQNVWHRHGLAARVSRIEAEARLTEHAVGINHEGTLGTFDSDKGGTKRKATSETFTKLDSGEIAPEKRRRVRGTDTSVNKVTSPTSLLKPRLSPATSLSPTIFHLPTITISFKRYNNNSRRIREFVNVDTMDKFWNQVAATPMFDTQQTNVLKVVKASVDGGKVLNLAQHDPLDYRDLVAQIRKAVAGKGNREVAVDVVAL